jgi:hypothetical protein
MLPPVELAGRKAMARGRRSPTPSIEEVRARFEQWRQTRQGKARIPDELWAAAVEVARRNGCNRTATALHVDGGKLRKQMLAAGAVGKKTAPPAFVELIAPAANSVAEYTIELEGGTLRIHCKGATATELAELSRALWSAGR